MLRLNLLVIALLLAGPAQAQRRLTDISQELMEPIIRGVAYDSANERVFAALCPDQPFGCDLVQINLNDGSTLNYLRSDGRYGYTQPAVSADGRYVFAARTLRSRRPGQREINQELVRIDLTSGDEAVVVAASQYRYERLIGLGQSGILAVQGYRSNERVDCRGDFCIDAARVVLITSDEVRVLPGVVATGEVASVRVSMVNLGAESALISAATGETENSNGVATRRVATWLFDGPAGRLSDPTTNVNAMRETFEQFDNAHPAEVRWRWMQIHPSGGPVELRAFPESITTVGGIQQVAVTDEGYGVRLTKRRDGRTMRIDIEVARNQGVSPWESVRQTSVLYDPPSRIRRTR